MSLDLQDYIIITAKCRRHNVNILRRFIVILILFMTPQTAIVYSRDQLLTLQIHAVLLNHGQCSVISQLRLSRRGCRTGAHLRRRLRAADRATFSTDSTTTRGKIPVVIGQRAEAVNRNQLFRGRRDSRVTALLHLSDVHSTTTPSFSSLSTSIRVTEAQKFRKLLHTNYP